MWEQKTPQESNFKKIIKIPRVKGNNQFNRDHLVPIGKKKKDTQYIFLKFQSSKKKNRHSKNFQWLGKKVHPPTNKY